jgi:FPC/CPF motif-containing protein YcgG
MIVRISIGHFATEQAGRIETLLNEGEKTLRPAISQLVGHIAYYVAIDKEKGYMTNTSLWQTPEDAVQMARLPEMLAQRDIFLAEGVVFMPITNHEVLWQL